MPFRARASIKSTTRRRALLAAVAALALAGFGAATAAAGPLDDPTPTTPMSFSCYSAACQPRSAERA